ncbi:ribose transport system permease protein [Thermocatellispora tengchongensis]|uniref:Ribose transport system permease protein n=1 Tax=Thermocatellispora tengchongensis TaxID=1073253 RepID=A0A840PIT4_9ACTN|nr:ABC transporter permease [Thermocatellispora tengchongensis]MBB5137460.1 ribose transport system permease protein [Thermocatellispora tengchongensis]
MAERIQTYGPAAALLALVAVFAVLSPQFRTLGNLQNLLDAGAVLAVVTIGATYVLILGCIDLSAAGVMGACALAVSLLVANSRTALDLGPLGVLLVVALGAAFGCLSGVLSVGLKVPSFMTTLGVSAIGLGVATVLFAGVQPTVSDPWLLQWASGRWLGFTRLTYLALATVALAWLVQRYTRLGRYALAIGGGEDILRLSGIRVGRYKVAAFTLAGACYGLAAVMITAQLGSGIVQAGAGLSFAAITAAVVGGTQLAGGRGGVAHSMVGVLILTVLANGLVLIGVSPYAQRAVQGVIVVFAVGATLWPLRHRLEVVK